VLGALGASAITVWRAAHDDDASRVERADVIIVLGAAQYGGTPSPVFRGRLDHAVLLFQQGRADSVMVVGGRAPGDPTSEAQAGWDYLVAHGVPAGSAVAEPVGRTTYESLAGAAKYMREHGMKSAFLVSDPWHNARIIRMASDLGITGYASATWTSAATSEEARFSGYARETLAYLYYRVFGR
jgi:vancomycin permeability regulator SanA